MLTSDIRTDFWPFLPPTAGSTNSLTPAAFGSGQAADFGRSFGAPFELLLAQVLLRLLDRLEATSPLPPAADSTLPPPINRASLPAPTWIYPTPAPQPAEDSLFVPQPSSFSLAEVAAKQAYQQAAPAPAPAPVPTPASALTPAPVPANQSVFSVQSSVVRLKTDDWRLTTDSTPLALSDFPRPPGDNGRGMHWIPTTASTPEVVDRFMSALKAMRIKWVTFLNDGANIGANDYLVQQLKANGMEPIMRIYTPGLQPVSGDLGAAVRHYKSLGVSYFQLYNEPNHSIENDGRQPDVSRYLDLWIPAAKAVIDNGGLPGFGALSPGGEFQDTEFLKQAIDGLQARGELGLLDQAWLAIHNYQGDRATADTGGFSRFKVYADILQEKLGRVLPMIGTEGGSFVSGPQDEARRITLVTDAYRYMVNREPYNFAYTYWVIANEAGGAADPAWEWQALIHKDGQSPLVDALRELT
ncbi:MAG: hypothetical protein HY260_04960 [Chloroflexi bacterium]|nr:hypothetical protein [Chloroflexota bacterium]